MTPNTYISDKIH